MTIKFCVVLAICCFGLTLARPYLTDYDSAELFDDNGEDYNWDYLFNDFFKKLDLSKEISQSSDEEKEGVNESTDSQFSERHYYQTEDQKSPSENSSVEVVSLDVTEEPVDKVQFEVIDGTNKAQETPKVQMMEFVSPELLDSHQQTLENNPNDYSEWFKHANNGYSKRWQELAGLHWDDDNNWDLEEDEGVSTTAAVEPEPEVSSELPSNKHVLISAHIPLDIFSDDHFKFQLFTKDSETPEIMSNNNNNIRNLRTTSVAPEIDDRVELLSQLSQTSSNSELLNREYTENIMEFNEAHKNLKETLDYLQRQNEQLYEEMINSGSDHSDYNSQQHKRMEAEVSAMLSKIDEVRGNLLKIQNIEEKRNYHSLLEALLKEIYGETRAMK